MQHKQMEEEELSLLEKKRQREVAKREFTDDLKFKTTLGGWLGNIDPSTNACLAIDFISSQLRMSIVLCFSPNHRRGMSSSLLEEW